jgi:prepilin-type processing-associated H-X9-DG protein
MILPRGALANDSDARGIREFAETDIGLDPLKRDVGDQHHGGFNAAFGDGHAETVLESSADQWAAVGG